jgi:hypothetical protein
MTDVLVLPPAARVVERGDEFDAYNARNLPLVLRLPLACKACPTRRIVVDKGSTTLRLIEGAIEAHVERHHRSNAGLARRRIGPVRAVVVTAEQANIRPLRRS